MKRTRQFIGYNIHMRVNYLCSLNFECDEDRYRQTNITCNTSSYVQMYENSLLNSKYFLQISVTSLKESFMKITPFSTLIVNNTCFGVKRILRIFRLVFEIHLLIAKSNKRPARAFHSCADLQADHENCLISHPKQVWGYLNRVTVKLVHVNM